MSTRTSPVSRSLEVVTAKARMSGGDSWTVPVDPAVSLLDPNQRPWQVEVDGRW